MEPLTTMRMAQAIKPWSLTYCPSMDLVAFATTDNRLHVIRFDNKEVSLTRAWDDGTPLQCIQWKPNGAIIALASKRHISLIDTLTGKQVHRIDCSEYSHDSICCVSWGMVLLEEGAARLSLDEIFDALEGAVMPSAGTDWATDLHVVPNLPKELALLDVEGLLPKLSTLPASSPENEIFTSRSAIDAIFQPLKTRDADMADVLIVGFEDGTIHVSIFNFFDIGSFDLSSRVSRDSCVRLLQHCHHPLATTHSLIVAGSSKKPPPLSLVLVDIRLLLKAGRLMSLVATKSTQIRTLIRYIQQVVEEMQRSLRATFEIPSRFMSNLAESLAEKDEWTWEQVLFHLVVTGDCPDEVREWLVEQLGERGFKRWDKAVMAGYEGVRRLAHENFIPALERCLIMISRLLGLSKFHVSNAHLDLSTKDLDAIVDTLNCLQLLGHKVLITSMSELQAYEAFSNWFRQEVHIQASENRSLENLETTADIDHALVLSYIRGPMKRSELHSFINDSKDRDPEKEIWKDCESLFALFTENQKAMDTTKMATKRLPSIETLLERLNSQTQRILRGIGDSQKRNVSIHTPIELRSRSSPHLDTRMISHHSNDFSQYVVTSHHDNTWAGLVMDEICFTIVDGVSQTTSTKYFVWEIKEWSVQDVKFINDEELLIIFVNDVSTCLQKLSYRPKDGAANSWAYKDTKSIASPAEILERVPLVVNKQSSWQWCSLDPDWAPFRIAINGRKGKRAVCVLAENRQCYRIYDLDG